MAGEIVIPSWIHNKNEDLPNLETLLMMVKSKRGFRYVGYPREQEQDFALRSVKCIIFHAVHSGIDICEYITHICENCPSEEGRKIPHMMSGVRIELLDWDNLINRAHEQLQRQYRWGNENKISVCDNYGLKLEYYILTLVDFINHGQKNSLVIRQTTKDAEQTSQKPYEEKIWHHTKSIDNLTARIIVELRQLQDAIIAARRNSNHFPVTKSECDMLVGLFESLSAELRCPAVEKERIIVVKEYTQTIESKFAKSVYDWGLGKLFDAVLSGFSKLIDALIGAPATSLLRLGMA